MTEEAAAPSGARFEAFQANSGEWFWRLTADNGLELSRSSEGYSSKEHAERAITATIAATGEAKIALEESEFEDTGGVEPAVGSEASA